MALFKKELLCLVVAIVTLTTSFGLPSLESDKQIKRITRSEDVDGYDIATFHALDPATNVESRQTKRDIQTLATDSSSNKRSFSLQLTSGERLRMSLERRSIDTSGAKFTEITEEGEEREIMMEPRDCFFSGPLEGGDKGFASLAMCDGELMGSITTNKRDYDIQLRRETTQTRDDDDDDAMRILVTWRDNQREQRELEDDGLKIPDDIIVDSQSGRRGLSDHNATVEIGDYVDRFFVEDVNTKLGKDTNQKIIDLIINKWSAAAHMLSNDAQVGWDLRLRLVKVVIMRTDPSYYVIQPDQKIGYRMNKICIGTKNENLDQVTLHTGRTSDLGRMGLAWVGGLCRPRWRCSAARSSNTNFRTELHELGHSLGLAHDGQIPECVSESHQTKGFMGGNRDHFRPCYKTVLARTLSKSKKDCIFHKANSVYVREFD